MVDVPPEVLARLGPSPIELSRSDSARVLSGGGLVAKIGQADRCAREALILGGLSALLTFDVPELVDQGDGWILMLELSADSETERGVEPLVAIGAMHETFQDASGLANPLLRDVFGREFDTLLTASRSVAADLPEPLASVQLDPSALREALDAHPHTLVHGDARRDNVTVGRDGFAWFDWEEAGAAPAAFDVARWIHGSLTATPSIDPDAELAAYLSARTTVEDHAAFRRAVDAAAVLSFLVLDLTAHGGAELPAGVVERRNLMARNLLG